MQKQFSVNNESFECDNCGKTVSKHPTSSRDHCNYCLFGKHVDENPGDRANTCKGVLEPIGIKRRSDKLQIAYKCRQCGETVFNVAAPDDDEQALIELSSLVYNI